MAVSYFQAICLCSAQLILLIIYSLLLLGLAQLGPRLFFRWFWGVSFFLARFPLSVNVIFNAFVFGSLFSLHLISCASLRYSQGLFLIVSSTD